MKKIILNISIFLFCSMNILYSQTMEREWPKDSVAKWSVGIKGGIDYFRVEPYESDGSRLNKFINQINWTFPSIFVEYTPTPYYGFGLDFGYFRYNREYLGEEHLGNTVDFTLFGSLNLSNLASPYREGFWKRTNLYANFGLGYGRYSFNRPQDEDFNKRSSTFLGTAALNFEYMVTPVIGLLVEGQYRYYTRESLGGAETQKGRGSDALAINVGIRWKMGASKKLHMRNIIPVKSAYNSDTVIIERIIQIESPQEVLDYLEDAEVDNKEIKSRIEELEDQLNQLKDKKSITISFDNIEFEFDSFNLTAESKGILDELIYLLKGNMVWERIIIAGHTDNKGSLQYNRNLSENRAKAVRDYLVSKGIDYSRLLTVGYGLEKPIDTNDTPEGRQRNRRVEFEIQR